MSCYLGQIGLFLMPHCCNELLLAEDGVFFDAPLAIVVVNCYLGQMELSLMPHCCGELLLGADGVIFDAQLL